MTDSGPLGRYERIRVLGTGSFATVWLAHDRVTNLDVALKVLADNWSRDFGVRERFLREARVLLQAESPYIIRVHHVAEHENQPYMVMAYADGGTLEQRMTQRRRNGEGFALDEVLSIGHDIARGIEATHELGQLHRDIKPANVLLHSNGDEPERIVLGDFGLARAIDDTAVTMISGSPGYVAPEQAAGLDQLDERADLFPLGLIITELLCGSPPFVSTSMKAAATRGEVSVRDHLASEGTEAPDWLVELLNSLLHPQPAGRPASARVVADHLEARVRNEAPPLPQPSGRPIVDKPRRSARLAVGLGISGLAIVGGLWWAVTGNDDDPESSTPTTLVTTSTVEAPDAQPPPSAAPATISVPQSLADSVPLPPNTRIDRFASRDGVLVVGNVALTIDQVLGFYNATPAGEWELMSSELTDNGAELRLVNVQAAAAAQVRISPTAASSGADITRVETRFSAS